MNTWAYDLPNVDLLKKFMNLCGEAGLSSSGMVIDIAAGYHLGEAQYFRGVVLSRLEGAGMPPLKPRDKVRVKGTNEVRELKWWYRSAPPGTTLTVRRIHYLHDHGAIWAIELVEMEPHERGVAVFNVESFERVPAETASAAAA